MNANRASTARLLYVSDGTGRDDGVLDAAAGVSDLSLVTASTVEDALSHVDAGVDCVASDHSDGGVDGLGVLEAVHERDPDLPVVLVPTDGDESLAGRAVAAGVDGYVPSDAADRGDALLELVREDLELRPTGRTDGTARMPIEDLGVREELRLKERSMDEAPVGITISDPAQPDNPLIYVNDAFERLTGYGKAETVGRNCRFLQGEESDPEAIRQMREAVDRQEPVSVELVNYRKNGEKYWNRVDIAPLRDEAGEVTHFVGFQTDVTARKEAELEVKRERENLEHLVSRINGLMQDVTSNLVQAASREEIEGAVCERVTDADSYAFGWIGEHDIASDAIVPTVQSGDWDPDGADLELDLRDDGPEWSPTARAAETRQIQVVQDADAIDGLVAAQPWLDGTGVEAVAAIPLAYKDTLYGVLTVYTTDRDELNDRETVVLEALGRATATALNALERGRILASDNVVELEFEVRDRSLFVVDLSATEGCDLEYNGSVSRSDGSTLMFFSTVASPAAVEALAADHPEVEEVTLVREGDDAHLFEFTVGEQSLVATLAERGAKLTTFVTADGAARLTVELPTEADARGIVELLKGRYPDTELVAYRERERPPTTKGEFISELEDRLTERQLTAIQTAYLGGFYEWNREISGDELANSMGVARSTFHQHLRAAERKLVEEFFER